MFIAILRLPCDHWKWPHFHTFVEEEQLSDYDSLFWKHLTKRRIRSGIMWSVSLSWTSKITQIWTIHSKSPIKENGKKFKKKKREGTSYLLFYLTSVYIHDISYWSCSKKTCSLDWAPYPWGWSKSQENAHLCVRATLVHVRITPGLLPKR